MRTGIPLPPIMTALSRLSVALAVVGLVVPATGVGCGGGHADLTTGNDGCCTTGTVTGFTITAGTGYNTAPTLALTAPYGSGAVATATVAGGAITGITITNAGMCDACLCFV